MDTTDTGGSTSTRVTTPTTPPTTPAPGRTRPGADGVASPAPGAVPYTSVATSDGGWDRGGSARQAIGGAAGRSTVTFGVRAASDWVWRLAVIAVGIYGFSRVFAKFSDILVPVMVALLISALLHPIADRIKGLPRPLAALLTMLAAFLIVVALFTLVGQQTASGFPELRNQAASGLVKVQGWLATGPLHLSTSTLAGYVTKAETALKANQTKVASGAVGVAGSISHLAEGAAITFFSTFFFLSSGHRIWAWLLRILPTGAQRPLDSAGRSGWVTLSHYVRATLIVACVDGLGVGIGTAILGVPLALPLGVVVFLGAFIPVVGALLTGVLAILVALVAKGLVTALIVLGIVIAVNQLEAHILQPFLLGRAVEVHPLAVILSLATGAALAGIVGALFAVPIAAVANTIITSLAGHREDPGDRESRDDAPMAPDKPGRTDIDKTPDLDRGSVTGAPTGR